MKIAIVGIQGLPNQYGGFETLSDFLVKYLAYKYEMTVYCSIPDQKEWPKEYNGAKLKYVNITSHGGKGILYDCRCLMDAIHSNYDIILILGFGSGLVMPFLSEKTKRKIILNFGGLDWKRDKWGRMAQWVIKVCEQMLVKNSRIVVSDNKKIMDYVMDEYGKLSELIAYGGDQVKKLSVTNVFFEKYPFLHKAYAFEVARIQSDNNIEMVMKAFEMADVMPLVLVGNWKSTLYGTQLKAKYEGRKNLVLLDAIYDQNVLDILRSNCYLYIHGHSAGGTNPSLCEAMYLGLPIMAFSNGYNQSTTFGKALYFENEEHLAHMVKETPKETLDEMRPVMEELAKKYYRWKFISQEYEKLFNRITKSK